MSDCTIISAIMQFHIDLEGWFCLERARVNMNHIARKSVQSLTSSQIAQLQKLAVILKFWMQQILLLYISLRK